MILVKFPIPAANECALQSLLREHHDAVARWPGYRRLCRLRPSEQDETAQPQNTQSTVRLLLEFDTAEQLTQWRASQAHQQLSVRYRQLWSGEPVVKFFQVQEAC
jgi:heme-degrading monooxygenase HmoA